MRSQLDVDVEATQHANWERVAAGWERWDDVVQQMLDPVAETVIRSLGIKADQYHLDVAAGTGQPGLTIAQPRPCGADGFVTDSGTS